MAIYLGMGNSQLKRTDYITELRNLGIVSFSPDAAYNYGALRMEAIPDSLSGVTLREIADRCHGNVPLMLQYMTSYDKPRGLECIPLVQELLRVLAKGDLMSEEDKLMRFFDVEAFHTAGWYLSQTLWNAWFVLHKDASPFDVMVELPIRTHTGLTLYVERPKNFWWAGRVDITMLMQAYLVNVATGVNGEQLAESYPKVLVYENKMPFNALVEEALEFRRQGIEIPQGWLLEWFKQRIVL